MTDLTELYQEIIIEEYQAPHNVGEIADADAKFVGHNASCGDRFEVFLKFDATREKIVAMKWRGEGCAISTASISLLSEVIKNKTFDEVRAMNKQLLEKLLGLENGISYGREKCLILGLTTVQNLLPLKSALAQKVS